MTDLSLIVPLFNGADLLPPMLASLRQLPADQVEIIFVDDCSTDGTVGLLEPLVSDRRNTELLRMPRRGGPGAATDRALAVCKGRFFQRLDQDDEVLPEGLLAALEAGLKAGAHAVIQPYLLARPSCVTSLQVRRPWSGANRGDSYWLGWEGAPWATMVSVEVVRRAGLEWPHLPWGGDQVFVAIAMARIPLSKVEFTEAPSYIWRHRPGSLSHPRSQSTAKFLGERGLFVAAHQDAMARLHAEGLVSRRDADRAGLRFAGQLIRGEWAAGNREAALRRWWSLWPRNWGAWRFWRLLVGLFFPRWLGRPSLLLKGIGKT